MFVFMTYLRLVPEYFKTRLISIKSQPKKIVVVWLAVVIGVVVVHVVVVVIPVVNTRKETYL